ncbi:HAD hydrolase-like protein [Lactiplantibacillus plantarum]|nr:HAD hydrolase-like protein [Lactiplantibacillus plantarum]
MREFLWDLDGTLLDTYPAMVQAFQKAVAELGGTIPADTTYQLMRQQSVGYAERMVAAQYGWDWHDLRAAINVGSHNYSMHRPPLRVLKRCLKKLSQLVVTII